MNKQRCIRFASNKIFALIFLLSLGLSAQAAIVQQVEAGFDGFAKIQTWMPVQFICENDTGETIEGNIVVWHARGIEKQEYRTPVSLPSPSRKVITVAVYTSSNSYHGQTLKLNWALLNKKKVIESGVVEFKMKNWDDALILAFNSQTNGIRALNGQQTMENAGQMRIISIEPSQIDTLPDQSLYYESINGILWGDVPPTLLNPAQIDAIENYVQSGGSLLAWGGPSASILKDTWLEPLLPVQIEGQEEIHHLPVLEKSFLEPLDLKNGLVITRTHLLDSDEPPAECLLRQGDIHLLARKPVGLGQTGWLAFNPCNPQIADWDALKDFLCYLVYNNDMLTQAISLGMRPNYEHQYRSNRYNRLQDLQSSLFRDPLLKPPSFRFIGFFLLMYVLVVGPLNYFILRRKKRLEWTWVTLPVIVLLFLGGEYTMGRYLKGHTIIVNKTELWMARSGDSAIQQYSLFGLFSPSKKGYDIRFTAEDGRVFPLQTNLYERLEKESLFRQTTQVALQDYPMNMWSMDPFWAQGHSELEGTIDIRMAIRNLGIGGTIANHSNLELKGAILRSGSGFTWVGDLAPEQTIRLKPNTIKWSNGWPQAFFIQTNEDRKRRAAQLCDFYKENQSAAQRHQIQLLAWVETPEQNLVLEGETFQLRQETLLCVRSDLNYRRTLIDTPDNWYQPRILNTDTEIMFDNQGISFDQGTLEIEMVPIHPLPTVQSIEALNLSASFTNGVGKPVSLEIINWENQQWISVETNLDSVTNHGKIDALDMNFDTSWSPNLTLLRPADQAVRLRFAINDPVASATATPTPGFIATTGKGMSMPGMGMPGMGRYPGYRDRIYINQIKLFLKGTPK